MTASNNDGATRILERPGQDPVLMVRRAAVAVSRGPDKGSRLELDGCRPVQIGTDPNCDLVLHDPAVSAIHCAIVPEPQGYLLRDLESTNGTVVDGLRIVAIYLPSGAQLELGQTRLRFTASKEEVAIPLSSKTRFGQLLGHSDAMRQVFAVLERVAASESTLLIEGESGTGKELAAQAVHEASGRDGLFVPVDCGALPPNLIESELFGHAKGAFTGAAGSKPGLFEEAERGTLFLDEVGELPLDLQPKLLRALESRTVRRLGETQPRQVDVRVLAATNRNLSHEVTAQRFREDLFYRLSVIRVRMPPLRERREEIPRLVAHFTAQLGHDPSRGIPETIKAMLIANHWPGNVRELRNAVERLVRLPGMEPQFYLQGVSDEPPAPVSAEGQGGLAVPLDLPFHEGKRRWTELFEREYLFRLLDRCGGNISELSRVSGLSRQSCHRLLGRHSLDDK